MEERVYKWLWIGVIDYTPGCDLILPRISTYRNGGLIYLFDLGVSTDLLGSKN